jgi:hypothetical protein
VLVEGVLAIEVQGTGKFLHDKPIRVRKDRAKRRSVEARGLGWMELKDYEVDRCLSWNSKDGRWVTPKSAVIWRPVIEDAITRMLRYSHLVNERFLEYQRSLPEMPVMNWPGIGVTPIDRRNE